MDNLLNHPKRKSTIEQALKDLPVILPYEVDILLETNKTIIDSIIDCQSSGRLEDALLLLRVLLNCTTALLTHHEIYTSSFPNNLEDSKDFQSKKLSKEAISYLKQQQQRASKILSAICDSQVLSLEDMEEIAEIQNRIINEIK